MAELLKGAPVARVLTEELAARCAVLCERGVVPMLVIVRVGEREDDLSYERGASSAARRLALRLAAYCFPPMFRRMSCWRLSRASMPIRLFTAVYCSARCPLGLTRMQLPRHSITPRMLTP